MSDNAKALIDAIVRAGREPARTISVGTVVRADSEELLVRLDGGGVCKAIGGGNYDKGDRITWQMTEYGNIMAIGTTGDKGVTGTARLSMSYPSVGASITCILDGFPAESKPQYQWYTGKGALDGFTDQSITLTGKAYDEAKNSYIYCKIFDASGARQGSLTTEETGRII